MKKKKEGEGSAHKKHRSLSFAVKNYCFEEMSFRSRPNDDDEDDKEEDVKEEKKKKATMMKMTTTMPPPPPRFRRQKQAEKKKTKIVLEEDEFAARLEHIIERDYFPNVPQMKDELRLLRAEREGERKGDFNGEEEHSETNERGGRGEKWDQ